jgi:hypothetical protein
LTIKAKYIFSLIFLTQVTNFHDKQKLDDIYISEIQDFLQQLTSADKVIAFGPTLRQTRPKHGSEYQPPGVDVHVDYTSSRSCNMAQNFLSNSDDPDFQYSRFQCINLWRAISSPPQDWPLAVCDAQTVDPTEGTPNAMIRVDTMPDLNNLGPLEDDPTRPEACLFYYKPE